MNTPFTPPVDQVQQEQTSSVVKSLKPLVYNFFVSQKPQCKEMTLEDISTNNYKSFYSHRLEVRNGHVFRPTIQFKRISEEPKFLLSVQRKKVKIMNGISQKASSEKPSRNSYRGRKLRTTSKTLNHEEIEQPEVQIKDKMIDPQHPRANSPNLKVKQPHLHFNLRFVLQSRRNFTGQFSREENITGSNFPYFNYFSSAKSSFPKSQRGSRYKSAKKSSVKSPNKSQPSRFASTTMNMRSKPFCENFS